jgi:hypothetical protein
MRKISKYVISKRCRNCPKAPIEEGGRSREPPGLVPERPGAIPAPLSRCNPLYEIP